MDGTQEDAETTDEMALDLPRRDEVVQDVTRGRAEGDDEDRVFGFDRLMVGGDGGICGVM